MFAVTIPKSAKPRRTSRNSNRSCTAVGVNVTARAIPDSIRVFTLGSVAYRVIEEVGSATSSCADGYHDCYLKLFELMRSRDREMAGTFNDPRRSNAFILLANIKELGLLTVQL